MVSETIKYTNFNGDEVEERHLFNFSEVEIMDLEFDKKPSLTERIQRIAQTQDKSDLYRMLKFFVLESYGEKSLDGTRFVKRDEAGNRLSDKFQETQAFSEFMFRLVTDADLSAEFINRVIPKNILEKAAKENARNNNTSN